MNSICGTLSYTQTRPFEFEFCIKIQKVEKMKKLKNQGKQENQNKTRKSRKGKNIMSMN